MSKLKIFFKKNSHNGFLKVLAGFGRSINRLYENRNNEVESNGELVILKKLAKFNPQIIIDGGANIGKYSTIAGDFCKTAKIYALEPVVDTYNILKKNVEKYENVIPVCKGFFKENCTKEINIYNSNTHSSLFDIEGLAYESEGKKNIELVKGDDFLKDNEIDEVDFLKLDIEGAEFDAFEGFKNAIKTGKIKLIQFEYGYINITTKKLLIDYYNFFEANGYIIGKIFPKIVEFRKYHFKYENFYNSNFVAVKKTEKELIEVLKRK